MKTKLLSLLAIVAILLCGSCSYDDSDLQNRVEQLEQDMTELQKTVSQMNTNLQALQTTVDVISSGDYIKSVSPVKAGDKIIGYTLTFGKNSPITIYNGENGTTPAISVKLAADGKYYWTLNGEVMKDAQGNDVPATGVAPSMRINDGIWQYSIDNGTTWKNVEVSGYAGVIFKTVEVGKAEVSIELADGTKFQIPLMGDFKLKFSQTYYYVANAGELTVDYTIEGADDMTSGIAFPSGDVQAVIAKKNASEGSITITRGESAEGDVQVLVMATNGRGQKDYEILNFANLELTVTSADIAFGAGESVQEIEISSTVEYQVVVPENVTWLTCSLAPAAKSNSSSDVLTITAQTNPLRRVRTADVQLVDKFGNVISTITIAQAAANYPAGGQLGDIPVLPA